MKETKVRERFWRHKQFPGWKSFLLTYFEAQKTAWSPTELATVFCENFSDEGYRIMTNIASTCSILEREEKILSVKVNGRHYYGIPEIFLPKEGSQRIIDGIKLRPHPKAFKVPERVKEPGFERIQVRRVRPEKKLVTVKPEAKAKRDQVLAERKHSEMGERLIKANEDFVIISRSEHNDKRRMDLRVAIGNKIIDDKPIPIEWIEEYNDLVNQTNK